MRVRPSGVNHDRGVSEVVGIALLVAITLLLVVVLAGAVVGFDGASDSSPTADFHFDFEDTGDDEAWVTVTHVGGDSLRAGSVTIEVEPTADGRWQWHERDWDIDARDDLVLGGTATSKLVDFSGSDEGVVRVVWTDSSGNETYVLAETEVPESVV